MIYGIIIRRCKMANNNKKLSIWQKTKNFLLKIINNPDQLGSEDKSGSGSDGNKTQGTGFIDPKAATHVKDPETIIYNELKKDPAAMLALSKLTKGQIPVSEQHAAYEAIRHSVTALETLANSQVAPINIKRKAQEELRIRKALGEPTFTLPTLKPPKPRPPGFN